MNYVKISMDDYLELLKARYEVASERWGGCDELFGQLLDFIADSGFSDGENTNPSFVVDNFIVNSEIVEKSNWRNEYPTIYEQYNGDWSRFVEYEAILFTDNYACINLGF